MSASEASSMWLFHADPAATMAHAIPHQVVSQVLSPEVAAFITPEKIARRSHHDQQCCVTCVKLVQELSAASFGPALDFAASLPHLSSVCLGYTKTDAAFLTGIGDRLPHLRVLDLVCCSVGVDSAAAVGRLAQLEELDLSFSAVNEEMAQQLVRLSPSLQVLKLSLCPGVEGVDGAMSQVRHLCGLHTLHLNGTMVDDRALSHLRPLVALRTLDLSYCGNVDAVGLRHVGALPRLRELNLSECQRVDASAIESLLPLTQLWRLALSRCRGINADALAVVRQLSGLQVLDITHCQNVTADALVLVQQRIKEVRH